MAGGYAGATYERHLTLGILVAIASVVTAGMVKLRRPFPRPWLPASRVVLALTVAVVIVAGHLGATLTHGEGYLTAYAPAPVRALIARAFPETAAPARPSDPERAVVFTSVVQPILRKHCVACHGADRTEGGLRLDTPEHLRAGGDDGPVLAPGRAASSEIVRRVWLPSSHEDAMPPKGRRPISPAAAAVLRWWVDSGASFTGTLADVEIPADVMPALEASLGPVSRGGPTVPSIPLPPVSAAQLAAIRTGGLGIEPVAAGSLFLQVYIAGRGSDVDDGRVATLAPVADHVLWLDLSGSAITDAAYATLARLSNLTRLNVSRTVSTDAGVAKLSTLARLEYLNLYGTHVSDAGIAGLTSLGRLRHLYAWQTGVTPEGAQRLRAALPRLQVVMETAETVGAAVKKADAPTR
jgi:mono/diheme cytochrome c family protein